MAKDPPAITLWLISTPPPQFLLSGPEIVGKPPAALLPRCFDVLRAAGVSRSYRGASLRRNHPNDYSDALSGAGRAGANGEEVPPRGAHIKTFLAMKFAKQHVLY